MAKRKIRGGFVVDGQGVILETPLQVIENSQEGNKHLGHPQVKLRNDKIVKQIIQQEMGYPKFAEFYTPLRVHPGDHLHVSHTLHITDTGHIYGGRRVVMRVYDVVGECSPIGSSLEGIVIQDGDGHVLAGTDKLLYNANTVERLYNVAKFDN